MIHIKPKINPQKTIKRGLGRVDGIRKKTFNYNMAKIWAEDAQKKFLKKFTWLKK